MSESHEVPDAEEGLLPDDAEQKISELLEALRESEERMMEGQPDGEGADDTPEAVPDAVTAEAEEFLSDEESDFVDLDAELLDNTSDMLELDEHDSAEEMLLDEIGKQAEVMPAAEEPEDDLDFVLTKESPLIGQHAEPLMVPAPARPRDAMPSWLSPLLATIAVALSGTALWFTLNAPAPVAAPPPAAVERGDERALESLKVDLAALRERLSVVEGETVEDREVIVVLERVQTIVNRMEQNLLNRPIIDSPPAVKAVAVAPRPAPVEEKKAELAAYVATDEAVAVPNRIYIKGWSVNLGSYYHKSDAQQRMQFYQQAGINAEIREIPKGNTTWHRLRVMGFASKKEANAFIGGLTIEQGRETAWPSRYQGYVDS